MARPTVRGWGLLTVTAGAYLAARILGTWELYLLSLAFLAALLVSWVLVQLTARDLTVERTLAPDRPAAGDAMRLTLRAENGSRLPGLQVTVRGPAGDLGEGRGGADREPAVQGGARRQRRPVGGATRRPSSARRCGSMRKTRSGSSAPGGRSGPAVDVTVYPHLVDLTSCVLFADLGRRRDGAGGGCRPWAALSSAVSGLTIPASP